MTENGINYLNLSNQGAINPQVLRIFRALINQKTSFNFVNVSFTLSAYYELSQIIVTVSTHFTLRGVLNEF